MTATDSAMSLLSTAVAAGATVRIAKHALGGKRRRKGKRKERVEGIL